MKIANGYIDIDVNDDHTSSRVHGGKWGVFTIEPFLLRRKTIVTIETISWHTEQLESNAICFDVDIYLVNIHCSCTDCLYHHFRFLEMKVMMVLEEFMCITDVLK